MNVNLNLSIIKGCRDNNCPTTSLNIRHQLTTMTLSKFSFLLLLTLLFQGFLPAQEWTSYQSPNQVNDLVDTGAELLLATDNGLVVIDKTTLEHTILTKDNSNLSNNHIQSITRGQNGSVWIGTYDIILFEFDGSDFQNSTSPDASVVLPNTDMYDLKIAPNGDLWVGTTKGLFHREGETWSRYAEEEFGPNYFETWDVEIMENGDVFAAGVELHQRVNDEWVSITEGSEWVGYLGADLFTSSTGDLYVAGDLDQIGRYDGQNWQEYDIDFNGSEVIQFTEDTDNNVYFSTRRNGIFKLEDSTWVQQEGQQASNFNNQIDFFYIDGQNRRWMNRNIRLSVNNNGNIRSTLIADHTLTSNRISNLHKGENGKMYFILDSSEEFSMLDEDGNWSFLPKPASVLPFERMNDFFVIDDNDIWLASLRGLYHYDGTEWMLTSLEGCRRLQQDSQGRLYAQADDRIYIVDNGVISELNTDNSSLTSLPLSSMSIDAEDNLWTASGSFDGGNVIQKVTPAGEWTTFSTADHPAINRPTGEFAFDNNGNVWIVNAPFGALKFDGTTWTDPVRETENGVLTTRGFDAVKSDAEGKLYFAHAYGISTLFNGEWENFVNEEVITNNSTSTNIEFDDEGTLWWANGRTGVFSFMPEPITSSSSPIELVADFRVFPNPALTHTTVDFTTRQNANVIVAIYNQLGQLASTTNLGQFSKGAYQQEINLDRLPAGFYTIQLRANNSVTARKLIID